MNILSHKRVRRLLQVPIADLSVTQQADLAYHLNTCLECRAYAQDIRALQLALSRAMHARWDHQPPSTTSSRAIHQRWKQRRLKHQAVRRIAVLASIGVAILLIVYSPAFLSPLFSVLKNYLGKPLVTAAPLPAYPTATAEEVSLPEFTLAFNAGESLNFNSDRDLYTVNSQGEALKNLTDPYDINHASFPVWSPDGSRIAFIDLQEGVTPDQGNKLYVISRDGTQLISMEPVLSAANVAPSNGHISWSPDSQRIAFEGMSNYARDIFLISAEGDQLENLTENFIYEDVGGGCSGLSSSLVKPCQQERLPERSPTWAPDGRKLAMVVDDRIFVIDVNGHQLIDVGGKIAEHRGGDIDHLHWMPDGKQIIFEYQGTIEDGIYSLSLDSGEVQYLGPGREPELTSDGMQLAFSRETSGIYVMDIQTQIVNHIVSNSSAFAPQWTPDGKFITFTSYNAYFGNTIWIVSKDGGWKKELLKDAGFYLEYSLSK